jgi:hypothetical protein
MSVHASPLTPDKETRNEADYYKGIGNRHMAAQVSHSYHTVYGIVYIPINDPHPSIQSNTVFYFTVPIGIRKSVRGILPIPIHLPPRTPKSHIPFQSCSRPLIPQTIRRRLNRCTTCHIPRTNLWKSPRPSRTIPLLSQRVCRRRRGL